MTSKQTTKQDVRDAAVNFNRLTQDSGRQIYVGFRNGYCALDVYEGTTCIRHLTAGTKREVLNFIQAMSAGIGLKAGA